MMEFLHSSFEVNVISSMIIEGFYSDDFIFTSVPFVFVPASTSNVNFTETSTVEDQTTTESSKTKEKQGQSSEIILVFNLIDEEQDEEYFTFVFRHD